MNRNIIAAIIVAIGLVAAAFVHAGRYYILAVDSGVAVKIDRWTGKTEMICADQFADACFYRQ